MNSGKSIANDVRPEISLSISAIGEPEESLGDDLQIQQDEQQAQVEDTDQEALVPQQVTDVSQPTQQEREEHNKTQFKFRTCCLHSVKGESNERNFAASEHEPTCLPCFSADYLFMGERDTEGTTPIFTLKDDKQCSVFADVVTHNGVHEFVTKQVLEDLDTIGCIDIIEDALRAEHRRPSLVVGVLSRQEYR